ncbi:hypothetical protein EVAR_31885_1 [Eumeta japonica]|uniref:Uncharacterized protein n=1 Tax=Eumeta variegata TaxID=151549 RepID=A0A4C1WZ78_EUMVA|nr:hypothetical protein EVAR_31885_1 [Eumeta japonica]
MILIKIPIAIQFSVLIPVLSQLPICFIFDSDRSSALHSDLGTALYLDSDHALVSNFSPTFDSDPGSVFGPDFSASRLTNSCSSSRLQFRFRYPVTILI